MHVLDLRAEAAPLRPNVPMPPPHLRDMAIGTWRGRMVNEFVSNRVFETLADQLTTAGLSEDSIARCREFAAEERRHGALCGAVVEAMGGQAIAKVPPLPEVPLHEDADALEGALRNVLSICCLSETVAVALIGAERLEMPEGPLHTLLTEIYADECGHCNFGWKLLQDELPDDDALKQRLGDYLAVAFAHVETHELAHLPVETEPPPEGVNWGLCSGANARILFYETIRTVIIPGLEGLGLPAQRAWDTRADVAP
jgi:hypothetical protein